ncbi:hypothetical protein ACFS07_08995 [Undibacterium arcticum]
MVRYALEMNLGWFKQKEYQTRQRDLRIAAGALTKSRRPKVLR